MITLLFQRYGLMALGWFASGLTVIGVLLGIRNAGKKAEQVEQMQQNLKVRNEQIKATLAAPRSRDELVDSLQNGKF